MRDAQANVSYLTDMLAWVDIIYQVSSFLRLDTDIDNKNILIAE